VEEQELLGVVARQTQEIDESRDRIAQLAKERRQIFAVLREEYKVTYKQLGKATGLHPVTIQANMGRFKEEFVKETSPSEPISSITGDEWDTNTTSLDSPKDAGVQSA